MPTKTERLGVLENLIDRTDLIQVLNDLREICGLKAEHVLENWQDETLCDAWNKADSALEDCIGNVPSRLCNRSIRNEST